MKSVLINQTKKIIDVALADLLELQDNLKKTSRESYHRFKERVLEEGFKYVFFYWQSPEGEKYIIDGHHRKKFLLKMKEEGIEIPEFYPSIEVEAKNKREAVKELLFLNSHYGQITTSGLKELLANYQIKPMELKQIRIEPLKVSFAKIAREIEEEENLTLNDEDVPESAAPLTRAGDLWQLNRHFLLCGDSTLKENLSHLMQDKKAAMVFTDPPYNISIKKDIGGEGGQKSIADFDEFYMAFGEMTPQEFNIFLQKVFSGLVQFSAPSSIHYICMNWRYAYELLTAAKNQYTELKNICVWNKDLGGMGTFYRSKHEFIFVYKNGKGRHINNFLLGQLGRCRTNVWDYPHVTSFKHGINNEELGLHPTVKPVAMIKDCCLDCSHPNQIILDPFLGSGSTLIACEKTERICYGLEIDPHYCDVIVSRFIRWMLYNGRKIEILKQNRQPIDYRKFL